MTKRIDFPTPTIGSAGHVGMAAGILGQNIDEKLEEWGKKYIAEHQIPMLVDSDNDDQNDEINYINACIKTLIDEVIEIASPLTVRALGYLDLDRWETVEYQGKPLVETKLVIPMPGWKGFVSIIDWVARDKKTNMTWTIDHKFRKQLQPDEAEEFNLQAAIYQFVEKTCGIHTIGSMTNQILMKLPSQPKQNKDGSMSRTKISTDWPTYELALINAGLDVLNYLDMKDKLNVEFLRQSYAYRNETEVNNIWHEIVESTSSEILLGRVPIRNQTFMNCRSCWMKDYCMEELRGGDLDWLMKTQYKIKEDRIKEVEEEEEIIAEEVR